MCVVHILSFQTPSVVEFCRYPRSNGHLKYTALSGGRANSTERGREALIWRWVPVEHCLVPRPHYSSR